MSIDINKLIKLNDLATISSRKRRIIVLNPDEEYDYIDNPDDNIVYDEVEWDIPDNIQTLVDQLSQNTQLSNEDKILIIYEQLCKDYIYDDNLISYIQKVDFHSFFLPDEYARKPKNKEEWRENRVEHNRRVCYEVSRYLAKSLEELFKDDENYGIAILWDKSLTHYFVALTCNDYSITLDLDDFDNIKDLTRIKAGLTAEGIIVLDDKKGKFTYALDRFNEGKSKEAIKKAEHDIIYNTSNNLNTNTEQTEENDDIIFLRNVLELLSQKYNLDSQGIYEYIKEIVDIKLGPESRSKVWKEIKGIDNKSTRYIRCLEIEVLGNKYLIDVDKAVLRPFDEKEFDDPESDFMPYKELQRNWRREPYDGT